MSILAPEHAAAATTATGTTAEHLVATLLVQLVVLLVVTRGVVWVARKVFGQTDAVGEMIAGVVLGPSLLGALHPEAMRALFAPVTAPIFVGVSQVGLIFLMFQIGIEFELRRELAKGKTRVLVLSLAGIAAPFALGFGVAELFRVRSPLPDGSLPPALPFRLFFGTAMSITAIPVLGRIFMELGLAKTRTAALTIGAAAVNDVLGWIVLGVVSAIVGSRLEPGMLVLKLGLVVLYAILVLVVLRPLLVRFVRASMAREKGLGPTLLSWMCVALFGSAIVTSKLGIFAILGGFLLGLALQTEHDFAEAWKARVTPLVQAFFLPLFFAYTGLRTEIGALSGASAWLECGLVCLVAFAGKLGGTYVAARALGEDHKTAVTIGVCMNTRGLIELVALNVGYDLGVLPKRMFTMLVIMAIVSTFVATPAIRFLMARERRAPEGDPESA